MSFFSPKKYKNIRLPFQGEVVLKFTNRCKSRDNVSGWEKSIATETVDEMLKSKVKTEEKVSFTHYH